jgi:hypothetical protein
MGFAVLWANLSVPNEHGARYQLEYVHIGIYSRGPRVVRPDVRGACGFVLTGVACAPPP